MNRVYFFKTHEDADQGVFVGAKNWREGRKAAMRTPVFDDYQFSEIRGHLCRIGEEPCLTEKEGELDPHDLIKAGYTSFYWNYYECERCKSVTTCEPVGDKMLCYECVEEIDAKEYIESESGLMAKEEAEKLLGIEEEPKVKTAIYREDGYVGRVEILEEKTERYKLKVLENLENAGGNRTPAVGTVFYVYKTKGAYVGWSLEFE